MSEKYSRLYTLQGNLYITDSPVIITAGALLKDNITGKVLAQVKFLNISSTPIKALRVIIEPRDIAGNPLDSKIEYQYLDLDIKRNEFFGTQTPIYLPDSSTRAYSVCVTEAIFSDNSTWKPADNNWEALEDTQSLEETLGNNELVKQYQITFGQNSQVAPLVQKDIWICTCNTVNRISEVSCNKCHNALSDLQQVDLKKLQTECEARLAQEQLQANQAQRKKKKLTTILTIVAFLTIATVIAIVAITMSQKATRERLEQQYNTALAMINNEQFHSAAIILEELGEYKDCPILLNEAKNHIQYNSALLALENKNYEQAYQIFSSLGDYEDSDLYHYEYLPVKKSIEILSGYFTGETTDTVYEYDNYGQLLKSTLSGYNKNNDPFTRYSSYEHNSDGTFSYAQGGNSATFDTSGHSIKTRDCESSYFTEPIYEFNTDGTVKKITIPGKTYYNGRHVVTRPQQDYEYVYQIDAENKISKKTVYDDDELIYTIEYKYDENDRIVEQIYYDDTNTVEMIVTYEYSKILTKAENTIQKYHHIYMMYFINIFY